MCAYARVCVHVSEGIRKGLNVKNKNDNKR